MSVTATTTITVGSTQFTATKTLSPADQVTISAGPVSIANGQTDKAISIGGVDVSQLVAVYLSSDAAITLETNSSSAPDDTITLAANVPYLWMTGDLDTCQITTDIASTIYATNSSGSTASVYLMFVQDGTP